MAAPLPEGQRKFPLGQVAQLSDSVPAQMIEYLWRVAG